MMSLACDQLAADWQCAKYTPTSWSTSTSRDIPWLVTLAFELQLSIDHKCIYLVASTYDVEANCKLISMQVRQMIPQLQRDETIYTWHTAIARSRNISKTSTQNSTRNSAAAEKPRDALYCLEIYFPINKSQRIPHYHCIEESYLAYHTSYEAKQLMQQNGRAVLSCRLSPLTSRALLLPAGN